MTPIVELPRVASIDATEFADLVFRRAQNHVKVLVQRLDPALKLMKPPGALRPSALVTQTRLWRAAYHFGRYAKTGDGSPDNAKKNLATIMRALYVTAGEHAGYQVPIDGAYGDPRTPFGVVLMAGVGRLKLAAHEPLTTRELAAVAGLNERRIRQLIDEGTLKRDPDESETVDRLTAKAFLAHRSVPGF